MGVAANTGVTVTIAGAPYTLRYSTNALVFFEQRTGKSIMELMDMAEDQMSLHMMRELLLAGFMFHHPKMTAETVGNLMDESGDMAGLIEKATEAMALALPQPEGGAAPGNAPAAEGPAA